LLCLTVISGWTIAFGLEGWKIMWTWGKGAFHPTLGNVTVICGIAVTLGGLTAESLRRYGSYEWKTKMILSMAKFHGVFGYVLILFS
jgi:hypothetical protein